MPLSIARVTLQCDSQYILTSWTGNRLIECDSVKIDIFYVVSGRGWSRVYTKGELVWMETLVRITYVMLQCNTQFFLTSWIGDRLDRR